MNEILHPIIQHQCVSGARIWNGLPVRHYVETARRYIVHQDHKKHVALLIPIIVPDHVVLLANLTQRAYTGRLTDCITVITGDGWMKAVPFKLTDACINVKMQDAVVMYQLNPVETFIYSQASEFDKTTRAQVLAGYFKGKVAT